MKLPFSHLRSGSTLVVTLTTLTALSLMAAFTLIRVRPRVQMAYQNAAWQESRIAAEAGIDSAINDLLLNATGFAPGAWTGWQEGVAPAKALELLGKKGAVPKSLKDAGQNKLEKLTAKIAAGKKKKGKKGDEDEDEDEDKGAGKVTKLVNGILVSALGEPTVATKSLFLDNVNISAAKALPAQVDVQLWGLDPTEETHERWYRIRAMGTCPLPPRAFGVPEILDAGLRRFSLRTVRPTLKKDDVGNATTIPLPNISRTVEVLVEPILSFELALWTGEKINLTALGTWNIDSYDSSDDTKSLNGLYPGKGSPLRQANGSLATSAAPAEDGPRQPLIVAQGTRVAGAVATNGGDDPQTKEHENVSGAAGIEPNRIRDDFSRQMIPLLRPEGEFMPPPSTGAYLTGPEDAPTIYSVHGSLTQLKIASPGEGRTGAVVILIDGNLQLTKPLIIPPSVIAILYVRGEISFAESVNSGPWNSNRAHQLLIFGDSAKLPQTLEAKGNIDVCAAFYGPKTDILLNGGVNWMGSLSGRSFQTTGSGDGGIHYDEALATIGPTIGFRIARYIEDVRE